MGTIRNAAFYRFFNILEDVMRKAIPLIGLLWIWFWPVPAGQGIYAQADSVRIGLVLSGGGAKGMAHLGVLKLLEEENIVPSYLAGTSMGAIVGAYYAAGYSADEIRKIFKETDFDDLLLDQIPRRYLPLYLKKTGRNDFFYFPVDLRRMSMHLPRGFSHSQLFYNKLFEDLYSIQYLESFDSLPIPVRFVATDLANGRLVELDSGSIPRAVIASSAIPSLVSPLKIDGKLLSDGGILDNYPVEQALEMGANYIIGSDVQGTLLKASQINSITDILDQIISIHMYADMPRKRQMTQVYIRPKVMDFGVTEFHLIDSLYRLGYREAVLHRSMLRPLARYSKPRPPRQPHPDTLVFSDIVINGLAQAKDREFILWKTGFQPRKKIAFKDFLQGINYLYGTGDYDQIHYWVKEGDTLVMDVVADTVRQKFKTAVHYSPLHHLEILGGLTGKKIFSAHDVFDVELIAGSQFRYNLNYLIDNGYHLGFGFYSGLQQWKKIVDYRLMFPYMTHPSFNTMDLQTSIWTNQVFFQGIITTNINFRTGLEHRRNTLSTSVFSGQESPLKYYFDRTDYLGGFLSFFYDDLNDFNFPEQGMRVLVDYHQYFSSDNPSPSGQNFHKINGEITGYHRHGRHFSSSYSLVAGVNLQDSISPGNYYYLGGIAGNPDIDMLVPFYSRPYMNQRTGSFVMFQPQLQWKYRKNHFFRVGSQMFFSEAEGQRFRSYGFTYNVYAQYGFRSYFGPIFATFGWEPSAGRWNAGVEIGFKF